MALVHDLLQRCIPSSEFDTTGSFWWFSHFVWTFLILGLDLCSISFHPSVKKLIHTRNSFTATLGMQACKARNKERLKWTLPDENLWFRKLHSAFVPCRLDSSFCSIFITFRWHWGRNTHGMRFIQVKSLKKIVTPTWKKKQILHWCSLQETLNRQMPNNHTHWLLKACPCCLVTRLCVTIKN